MAYTDRAGQRVLPCYFGSQIEIIESAGLLHRVRLFSKVYSNRNFKNLNRLSLYGRPSKLAMLHGGDRIGNDVHFSNLLRVACSRVKGNFVSAQGETLWLNNDTYVHMYS